LGGRTTNLTAELTIRREEEKYIWRGERETTTRRLFFSRRNEKTTETSRSITTGAHHERIVSARTYTPLNTSPQAAKVGRDSKKGRGHHTSGTRPTKSKGPPIYKFAEIEQQRNKREMQHESELHTPREATEEVTCTRRKCRGSTIR